MLVWRWADVSMSPSMSQLPGGDTLQGLVNGLGAWALVAALVGLVVGAAAWALGVHSQNFQQSLVGRRAVLVSGLAALLIGAGPAIINFFYGAGTQGPLSSLGRTSRRLRRIPLIGSDTPVLTAFALMSHVVAGAARSRPRRDRVPPRRLSRSRRRRDARASTR